MFHRILKNKKLRVKPSTHKFYKVIWLSLGILFSLLGVLGMIVPVIPGIPFLIPGVYFLAKSSSRMHEWMKTHKHLGKYFHHE